MGEVCGATGSREVVLFGSEGRRYARVVGDLTCTDPPHDPAGVHYDSTYSVEFGGETGS